MVDNYIKSWTGTGGAKVLQLSDALLMAAQGKSKPVPPEWTVEEMPFVNEFMSRYPSHRSQAVADFYESKDRIDKVYNSIQALMKKPDENQHVLEMMNAHPEFQVRLGGIASGITKAHQSMNDVVNSNESAVQKRQIVDTLQMQINE